MKITICSLFPEYFSSPLACSILARAQSSGKLEVELLNYRDFATSADGRVDDRPYGGGPGMILQPQIIAATLRSLGDQSAFHRIHLSASGTPLTAARARSLSHHEHLILICGHYEGIDQRAIDAFVDEEISMGDFILTNGCPAALSLLDAVARFLPGVLGNPDANRSESFESKLLEAPQYTRPLVFEEMRVPDILRSGDHESIRDWKSARSLEKTLAKRPDLLQQPPHQSSFRKDARPDQRDSTPFSVRASWEVADLKEQISWFGTKWPFLCKSIQERTVLIDMPTCRVELLEKKPETTALINTHLSFFIDLPPLLSRRVWQRAQANRCQIADAAPQLGGFKGRKTQIRRVRDIDPAGVTWHWNCSF